MFPKGQLRMQFSICSAYCANENKSNDYLRACQVECGDRQGVPVLLISLVETTTTSNSSSPCWTRPSFAQGVLAVWWSYPYPGMTWSWWCSLTTWPPEGRSVCKCRSSRPPSTSPCTPTQRCDRLQEEPGDRLPEPPSMEIDVERYRRGHRLCGWLSQHGTRRQIIWFSSLEERFWPHSWKNGLVCLGKN